MKVSMSETYKENNLEAEIAELNREIEAKRAQLEKEKGIVEERDVVKEVVSQHVYASDEVSDGAAIPAKSTSAPAVPTANYLDGLDTDTILTVNSLISAIPEMGIKKTITKARTEHPLILDAFHDALVNNLYEELKERGLIK